MNSDNPKITILLATFNRAHLIAETLDSILAQTYINWECLIVDDHSKDGTEGVIAKYIAQDSRFEYYLKTDNYQPGLSGTRNYGLDLAAERNAEFIQFFDDDDIMHPQKLELQIRPLLASNILQFTVCKFQKILENTNGRKIINPEMNLDSIHFGNSVLTGKVRINSLCPLFRMSLINRFRFDESLKYAEEWELFVRMGYLSPVKYLVIDDYLFQYRKHTNSLTMGEDKNYEKMKTSAVVRVKILNFLNKHNLHTEQSIYFLGKNFLAVQPAPELVKKLINYCKRHEIYSLTTFKLNAGLFLYRIYSSLMAKLFPI